MKNLITSEMNKPKPYGFFHISFIALNLIITIILSILFKNISDKDFRKVIAILWAIIFILEFIKQMFDMKVSDPKNRYKIESIPYQFCSLSLYIYPFIVLLNDSSIRNVLIVFSSTFLMLAGIIVYIVPTTFNKYVFLSVQTMIHHGMQIIVGVLLISRYSNAFTIRNSLLSILVLLSSITLAFILNETIYPLLKNDNNKLNLFYISTHIDNEVPVFNKIYKKSYLLFIFTYIITFISAGFITFLVIKLILLI